MSICAKCGKEAMCLYGIPGHEIGRYMPNPLAPKYCYECYIEDYGTDEEREDLKREEELALDRSIESDAFPMK